MTKFILTLAITITNLFSVFGQCCPEIEFIKLKPTNPTINDSVYLITSVTTSTLGNYLGYELKKNGSDFVVDACYSSSWLTAIENYKDTINIGKLPSGRYNLVFNAFLSNSPNICDKVDSNSIKINFNVTATTSIFNQELDNEIVLFPIPNNLDKITIYSKSILESIEIIDSNGRLKKRIFDIDNSFTVIPMENYPKGVYIIKIWTKDGNYVTKRISLTD